MGFLEGPWLLCICIVALALFGPLIFYLREWWKERKKKRKSEQESRPTVPIATVFKIQSLATTSYRINGSLRMSTTFRLHPVYIPDGDDSNVENPVYIPDADDSNVENTIYIPDGDESNVEHPVYIPDGDETNVEHPVQIPDGDESNVEHLVYIPDGDESNVDTRRVSDSLVTQQTSDLVLSCYTEDEVDPPCYESLQRLQQNVENRSCTRICINRSDRTTESTAVHISTVYLPNTEAYQRDGIHLSDRETLNIFSTAENVDMPPTYEELFPNA